MYYYIIIFCIYFFYIVQLIFYLFFFRCFIIEIYYNFYFFLKIDDIEYFLYKYALSPFSRRCIYFITTFYYFNIIVYILIILYYSLYNFLYLFDRSFDDAFFRFNSGYKIYLKKSGLEKLIKYQNFLLYFSKREETDCHFIWGKDFFFKNYNNNKRYKRGYL